MKRRGRRGLAFILSFVLVGAAWVLPVSPVSAETGTGTQREEVKKPTVIENTTESITLRTETNYEYAIETEKSNVKAWKWADAGQYDKVNRAVIFAGLKAGTEYKFACRSTGNEAVLYQNTGYTKAAEKDMENHPITTSSETTGQQNDAKMTPTETQEGKKEIQTPIEVNQETEATQESETLKTDDKSEPEDNVTNQTDTATSMQDNGKSEDSLLQPGETKTVENHNQITSAGTTNSTDMGSSVKSGEQKNSGRPKNLQPTKPKAPGISAVTDTTITLALPDDADIRYKYEYSVDGKDYQTEAEFTGLTPNTDYKFCIRIPAGEYQGTLYDDSENSDFTENVRTKESPPVKPQYPPVMAARTDTSISLAASKNEKEPGTLEFGRVISATDIQWSTTEIFDSLTPGTEYEFVVRHKVDESKQMPGTVSEVLRTATLQSAAAAPPAPELLKRSDTVIVLKEADNQQYGMVLADGTIKWQDSPEFGRLNPATQYTFAARTKYDPDKAMESLVSDVSKFKTAIAFQGARISGIENGGSYEVDVTWTATVIGVGMENVSPAVGDTRWVPRTWSWNGKAAKSWDKPPYTIKFKCTRLAAYELTVGYQLEEYTEKGWQPTEYKNSLSTSFNTMKKK